MNTEEQIKNTQRAIDAEEAIIQVNGKAMAALQIERDNKLKPHLEIVETIRNEYKEKILPYEMAGSRAGDRQNELHSKLKALEYQLTIETTTATGSHNVESITALMESMRIRPEIGEYHYSKYSKKSTDDRGVIKKRPLKNGLDVFRVKTWEGTYWLVFDKLRLVGLTYRRKGDHPGDQTTAYSFIGQLDDVLTKQVKYSEWEGAKYHDVNATYLDMAKELSNLDLAKERPQEIPLTEENKTAIKERVSPGEKKKAPTERSSWDY